MSESNAQYYSGQHLVEVPSGSPSTNEFTFLNFNTQLVSAFNISGVQVDSASNFNLYRIATPGAVPTLIPESEVSIVNPEGTKVRTTSSYSGGWILCQLKQSAITENYGDYRYVSLDDIINNFLITYVGQDKLIPRVKRSDVIFHAKRGLQEFSYDTLKSIRSQELTIPPSLSVPMPQDYVNYVRLSWIDEGGIRRIIYPTRITSNPTELPLQDNKGIPTQDFFENNLEAQQSLTEEKYKTQDWNYNDIWQQYPWGDYWGYYPTLNWYGRMYGLNPEEAQANGRFTINERLGKISFSSDLAGLCIVFEYISDGLSPNGDTKVPKLAEDAMYKHIVHSLLATMRNVPEYVVKRYQKDRSAALRNAKIRLSNIKSDEFVQVMRGKSKWIKH